MDRQIVFLLSLILFIRCCQTKTIFAIFAGRSKYVKILREYVDSLLKKKLIDEVHLWDYTENHEDRDYLKTIISARYVIKLRSSGSIRLLNFNGQNFGAFYEYYANSKGYNDNDIIIKCDDDIVYIDVKRFSSYLKTIKNDGLYFPNIVNNDVGAFIQTKFGVHDLLPVSAIPSNESFALGYSGPLTGGRNETQHNGSYSQG